VTIILILLELFTAHLVREPRRIGPEPCRCSIEHNPSAVSRIHRHK
jgi:hypothetical protein